MKFSRVISRVRWFSFVETNVSKTTSVLVLRVVEIIRVRWTTQSFYLYLSKLRSQGCPLAFETLVSTKLNHLTRLITRENFIK
jgi:hypothetical protein